MTNAWPTITLDVPDQCTNGCAWQYQREDEIYECAICGTSRYGEDIAPELPVNPLNSRFRDPSYTGI